MSHGESFLFGKLNALSLLSLERAVQLAQAHNAKEADLGHLFLAVLEHENCDLHAILSYFDIDADAVSKELSRSMRPEPGEGSRPALSPKIKGLLGPSWTLASEMNHSAIRSGSLAGVAFSRNQFRRALALQSPLLVKVDAIKLAENLERILRGSIEQGQPPANMLKSRAELPGTAPTAGGAEPIEQSATPSLDQFTIDMTAVAADKAKPPDPVRGRNSEIRQVIDILMRRRQNNPILVGEAGVGKTAVVEGFAQQLVAGNVPSSLKEVSVRALDVGLLKAGASVRGEFEKRLKSVIAEVQSSPRPIILFIDEAHTMIGASDGGGQADAANLLKPALARGELRTIAATTWSEYKRYIEKDPALSRRFQLVKVDEPSEEAAIEMMRGIAPNLEEHHHVRVTDEALIATVKLSARYLSDRKLPDKAVSVLDTACARVALALDSTPGEIEELDRKLESTRLEHELLRREEATGYDHGERLAVLREQHQRLTAEKTTLGARWESEKTLAQDIWAAEKGLEASSSGTEGVMDSDTRGVDKMQLSSLREQLRHMQGESPLVSTCVDPNMVASVVSGWTGIPVGRMMTDELRSILTLKERMEERIVGQSHALDGLARRISTSRAQLEDPGKPKGVFLLVGPSGVGKTETALALAELLFGGTQNLVTVNMSEFQEPHTVSTLKGSPPGYVGYGEGGVLTEAVRRKPYSVVLLDEMEKAHSDVAELFFQVFDKGVLEDGEGVQVDFKNTLILLTSNVGSDVILDACAQEAEPDPEKLIGLLRPQLLKHFKAAFLGRVTVIPYYYLGDEQLVDIVRLKLGHIQRRIAENHGAQMTYADAVVAAITERCTEVESGARNIDRILTQDLLPVLSTRLLEHMAEGQGVNTVALGIGENGNLRCDIVN